MSNASNITAVLGTFVLLHGQVYQVLPSTERNRVFLSRDGGNNGYVCRASDGGVMDRGRYLEPATAAQGEAMLAEYAARCRASDAEASRLLDAERWARR